MQSFKSKLKRFGREHLKSIQRRNAAVRRAAPVRVMAVGFAAVILIGTLLLMLPFATRSGESAGAVTALFTATSATCVTGLVVEDTYLFWSPFGQAVIL